MKRAIAVVAAFASLANGADTWVRPSAQPASSRLTAAVVEADAAASGACRIVGRKEKRLEWFRDGRSTASSSTGASTPSRPANGTASARRASANG